MRNQLTIYFPKKNETGLWVCFFMEAARLFFCGGGDFFIDFFVEYFIDHSTGCMLLLMCIGEMAEWLKASDCKSDDVCLRRFESCSLHHPVALFVLHLWYKRRIRVVL